MDGASVAPDTDDAVGQRTGGNCTAPALDAQKDTVVEDRYQYGPIGQPSPT